MKDADTDTTGGAAAARAAAAAAAAADVDRAEARIVELTNRYRSKEGRQGVQTNKDLHATARYFAEYMARTDRYGHTADGSRPSDRAERHGYAYCLVSENIAYQYNSAGLSAEELAKRLTQGWIDSPGHRRNMLEPDVVDTGAGVARSADGVYYAVQMFGRPESMKVEFKVVNRTDRDVAYSVGDQRYELPPSVTRTHTRCRPSELSFRLSSPGGGDADAPDEAAVKPKNGDVYVITAGPGGSLAVRRGDRARE